MSQLVIVVTPLQLLFDKTQLFGKFGPATQFQCFIVISFALCEYFNIPGLGWWWFSAKSWKSYFMWETWTIYDIYDLYMTKDYLWHCSLENSNVVHDYFRPKRRKTVQIVNFLSNANDRGLHLPFPRLVGSNIFFQSDSIYFLQYSKQILNIFLNQLFCTLYNNYVYKKILKTHQQDHALHNSWWETFHINNKIKDLKISPTRSCSS